MKNEIWLKYPFSEIYEISSMGNIKRKGKIIKPTLVGKDKNYLKINLLINSIYKSVRLHNIIAQTFIPNPNNFSKVRHIDGNTLNNNIENLEWLSSIKIKSLNTNRERDEKGRFIKGMKAIQTSEIREKISKTKLAKKQKQTKEHIEKLQKTRKGRKWKEEQRKKIIEKISKENHWNWQGGITEINSGLRRTTEYKKLTKSILKRDNYTCQVCGKYGGYLEVDHIKRWRDYPELRMEPSNLRTLCLPCHLLTHNYGNRKQKN